MYRCIFCLATILKKEDFHSCNECSLERMCRDCSILHKEHHFAKDYPVALLINNMINLPLNKTMIKGNNMW